MSQRRAGVASQKEAIKSVDELVPFTETLEEAGTAPIIDRTPAVEKPPSRSLRSGAVSMDDQYEKEALSAKETEWMEGPFATGMHEPTWASEYAKFRSNPYRQCMESTDGDGAPCNCCSALLCGMLGAGRVGNMAVLKQSSEMVEEVVYDGDGREPTVRRYKRPKLDFVVGPYWPMLLCVTYPLIFGLSGVTLVTAIPGKHPIIQLVWGCLTIGLIYALAMTAFRDPGILPRHIQEPPQSDNQWRWSDRAYSFRPRGAYYDPDTGVIVEGFDHTCPWTGTAIGKKNMTSFQFFVGLIFVCLMFDIVLLTGGMR